MRHQGDGASRLRVFAAVVLAELAVGIMPPRPATANVNTYPATIRRAT